MKYHLIVSIISFAFIIGFGCGPKQNTPISQPKAIIIYKEPTSANTPVAPEPKVQDCSTDMIHVSGMYCSKLEERICIKQARDKRFCLEFSDKPIKCLGSEKEVNFCIDKEEFTSVVDGLVPIHNITYFQAETMCANVGKRLCMDYEWTQACEGPKRIPFAQGYNKGNICNVDISKGIVVNKLLVDYTKPINENPECLSPYGVHNMSGNVDEVVTKSWGYKPDRTGLKGGYWTQSRNMCRPMTTEHSDFYGSIQTGTRCCKEVSK